MICVVKHHRQTFEGAQDYHRKDVWMWATKSGGTSFVAEVIPATFKAILSERTKW